MDHDENADLVRADDLLDLDPDLENWRCICISCMPSLWHDVDLPSLPPSLPSPVTGPRHTHLPSSLYFPMAPFLWITKRQASPVERSVSTLPLSVVPAGGVLWGPPG